jgi:hypothetical protein
MAIPNRARIDVVMILHPNGAKTLPYGPDGQTVQWPLEAGDQVLLMREAKGMKVDKDCILAGFSKDGPIFHNKEIR